MNKKGAAIGAIGTVVVLVAGGVALILGVLTFSKVGGAIDQSGFTTAENTTVTSVKGNVLDSLELAGIGLIVLSIAVVIGYLVMMGR